MRGDCRPKRASDALGDKMPGDGQARPSPATVSTRKSTGLGGCMRGRKASSDGHRRARFGQGLVHCREPGKLAKTGDVTRARHARYGAAARRKSAPAAADMVFERVWRRPG